MKRIRLTIEWDGACSEEVWAYVLGELIENSDASHLTHVTIVELLTRRGLTMARPRWNFLGRVRTHLAAAWVSKRLSTEVRNGEAQAR